MAWERAEEAVLLVSLQLGNVKGHRVGFLGADHLGVGDNALVTGLQVILVDACAQTVGGNRLHVSFFADHQVVAHDVLRQGTGVSQFNGESLAALVDFDGLGVEGHLVGRVDRDLALSGEYLSAGEGQQGYCNNFGKHRESPWQGFLSV
ncbi:hypothetical protein D3C77_511710 [compost metagenome]